MNTSAIRQIPIRTQTQAEFSIQKNGLRSSKISRKVPPPNAVKPETVIMPTRSSRFRAASRSPESAKAKIPITSKRSVPFITNQPVKSSKAQTRSLPLEVLPMLWPGGHSRNIVTHKRQKQLETKNQWNYGDHHSSGACGNTVGK